MTDGDQHPQRHRTTRRSLLRRTGVGAAAVWTVPAVQLVSAAPSAAAGSIGCTPNVAISGATPSGSGSVAGWWTNGTASTGTVAIGDEFGAPDGFGCSAVVLRTGTNSAGKARLVNYSLRGQSVLPSSIDDIGYWAYRQAHGTGQAAHLSLNITVQRSWPQQATLVYEPYMNGQSSIVNNTWQYWNATDTAAGKGRWWISGGGLSQSDEGSQSKPREWAFVRSVFPNAPVVSFGFNVGTGTPDVVVAGDGLTFNGVLTDF